jgi:hypothetical protein
MLLRAVVWLHENFMPFRAAFNNFVQYRKSRTAEHRSHLSQQYTHLVDYLSSLEASIPAEALRQSRPDMKL